MHNEVRFYSSSTSYLYKSHTMSFVKIKKRKFLSFYLMFIIDFPYSNLFVRLLSGVKKTFHFMNWRFGGRNDNVSFVWWYEQIRFFKIKDGTPRGTCTLVTRYNTHLTGMDEILVKAPQTENVNKLIVCNTIPYHR